MNKQPKQPTKEERAAQIARFLSQKRESYFQGILFNIIQTGKNTNIKEMIDVALEGADYALEKLFPIAGEKTED